MKPYTLEKYKLAGEKLKEIDSLVNRAKELSMGISTLLNVAPVHIDSDVKDVEKKLITLMLEDGHFPDVTGIFSNNQNR